MNDLENQQAYLQDRWAQKVYMDPLLHGEVRQAGRLLAAIEGISGTDEEGLERARMTAFYLVANLWEGRELRARGHVSAEEHVARRRLEEAKLAALGEPPAYPLMAINPELAELLGILDEANRQTGEDK